VLAHFSSEIIATSHDMFLLHAVFLHLMPQFPDVYFPPHLLYHFRLSSTCSIVVTAIADQFESKFYFAEDHYCKCLFWLFMFNKLW
jgi:hypothetical protein